MAGSRLAGSTADRRGMIQIPPLDSAVSGSITGAITSGSLTGSPSQGAVEPGWIKRACEVFWSHSQVGAGTEDRSVE